VKSYLPGFFFSTKECLPVEFLDLSQGTVCREIGLAGSQLPPLPFSQEEVAPLSTAAVCTDFTASFQKPHTLCCSERAPPFPSSCFLFSGPCRCTVASHLLKKVSDVGFLFLFLFFY
jgi:hypothetical protein